ncbi:carbamoyltransferase HypF [Promethearchaeum syntrophicum]|uniref:Carbamoyltransferase n=1 Tax=Promethearchaeum syntrophicum TaxID=2594042 RepID=A0A5B9DGC3_9ARCH|nr:carbamoyltransferase HypF [Candidatus Prometheoarchaeum syntrophicum]QEE18105.1 tRNA N6-adenosine threonylcarbamoyltransferase, mitochondrial [Candidatus Prometheoarchaeum syntrophicum]
MKQQKIIITGIVQGVGFRPFLYNFLRSYHLKGKIQNTGNLGVSLELQSSDDDFNFQNLIQDLKKKVPKMAFIEDIRLLPFSNIQQQVKFDQLQIIPSNEGIGAGLTLPPDIAMCDKCLHDFNNKSNSSFFHYPFISCAQCGPRFTIMESLPYDREYSMMDEFPFCEDCKKIFSNIDNRRFHAQTFGCNSCGPHYFDEISQREPSQKDLPKIIEKMVEAIKIGKIIALKGIGGVNLVCRADKEQSIQTLRNRKKERKFKPFAVMMPNLETARKYCEIPKEFETILTSFRRPIILFKKKEGTLPENLSPGLPNIGIILPYMGLHYLLFEKLGKIPLVFTSGNVSSLPMAIENTMIKKHMVNLADEIYLHNRKIYQRCDDSVIRPVLNSPILIRRSRGYVPEYYKLPFKTNTKSIIATGAELNSTGAISRGERIFPTQHIGNVRNLDTYEFLENAILHMQHLLKITDSEINAIGRDMHPLFQSSRLASKLLENLNKSKNGKGKEISIWSVQHHHAHLASLMVDNKMPMDSEMIAITIDGVGYGSDKQPWGGEILRGGYSSFERLGHLEPIPMVGGDLCAKYPPRMLLCTLMNSVGYKENPEIIEELTSKLNLAQYFPQGFQEIKYITNKFNQLDEITPQKHPRTSSFGRYLDAISSLFGVSQLRTYRGEPAMRLEGFIWNGTPKTYFNLDQYLHGNVILSDQLLWDYTNLLLTEPKFKKKKEQKDLARSLVTDTSKLFAQIAIRNSEEVGIKDIGVSGGVAYNEIIMQVIKSEVEKRGFRFLQHKNIAPGDAGVSIGQIASIIARLKL